MADTIKSALRQGKTGFYIGQRLILPFRCQLIKIMVGGNIFTEMIGSKDLKISQDPKNTSIYFRTVGGLKNLVGSYKVVKIIATEWEAKLCDIENHIKLVCEMKDEHKVAIHEPDDDMLFIE